MSKTALFIAAVVLAVSYLSAAEYPAYAVGPGSPAPDFSLPDLNGKKTALSEFRGKVVLLNFWAAYCGPCREEMPGLNKLYREFRDKGLVVIAVSIGRAEKAEQEFARTNKIEFPMLWDKDKEVYFDVYALFGLPVTVIIDRNGKVVEKVIGEREWDSAETRTKIEKLLEGGKK